MPATTRTTVRVRVLNLPFRGDAGGFDDSELVRLVAGADGAQVSEHFFLHQNRPYLVCFVRWGETWGEESAPSSPSPPSPLRSPAQSRSQSRSSAERRPSRRRSRTGDAGSPESGTVDADGPPLELEPLAQRIHDSLRAWRAGRARELGVPAYRVLTNRQIEALARSRPSDDGALLAIEGIGPATVRVHGEAIVRRVRDALGSAAAAPAVAAPMAAAASGAA